ncbi:MAG: alpha/beta hydrolase [Christensenellales bacterium]|jgi:putative tributyrin esterase
MQETLKGTFSVSMLLPALKPGGDFFDIKRQNNFIAGLSMGGFGALKAALRNPGQYAAAASLSGGVQIRRPGPSQEAVPGAPSSVPTAKYLFGAYGSDYQYYNSEHEDLRVILKNAVDAGEPLPKLYLCCGTEDFLYQSNLEYRDYALSLGVDLTYAEGPGVHDWDFWDPYIRRILDWLPLKCGFVD